MSKLLRDIYVRRELLGMLVLRNIKIRYKNSVLGFFWTLLGPIFLILVYSLFLRVLRFSIPLPVLVTGIIVWQFLSMCLGDSLRTITGNANLVTKIAFPRFILPLSMVIANLINFLLSSIVLIGYLLIVGVNFGDFGSLPLIVITHLSLCLGISLILSCLNVFFRDTEHILSIVMLAWFLMTPVVYPFEIIPPRFQHLAALNPMAGIVSAYRGVFLSANPMSREMIIVSFAIAWAVLLIGIVFFQKLQARFAEEL